MTTSVITSKGQIVIPKYIRDKYKLNPGVKMVFEETEQGILLRPADKTYLRSLMGILKKDKQSVWDWKTELRKEEEAALHHKLQVLNEPQAVYKKIKTIKRKGK
jgi:AbrB family looped-hinge helix DNA binding protein